MSLFSKNKESKTKIMDVVWMNETAKWNACLNAFQQSSSTIFIAWFEQTLQHLQSFFNTHSITNTKVFLYRNVTSLTVHNNAVIFIEHYPLHQKEEELFQNLHLTEATIFSSLDEPLFKQFGSDKIIELMRSMGMQETESIQHTLVTTALKNAQEKIAKKISFDQSGRSQAEWFQKNII